MVLIVCPWEDIFPGGKTTYMQFVWQQKTNPLIYQLGNGSCYWIAICQEYIMERERESPSAYRACQMIMWSSMASGKRC